MGASSRQFCYRLVPGSVPNNHFLEPEPEDADQNQFDYPAQSRYSVSISLLLLVDLSTYAE